jgi:hypothetical protein
MASPALTDAQQALRVNSAAIPASLQSARVSAQHHTDIEMERLRPADRRNFEGHARGVGLGAEQRSRAECHSRQKCHGQILQHV